MEGGTLVADVIGVWLGADCGMAFNFDDMALSGMRDEDTYRKDPELRS